MEEEFKQEKFKQEYLRFVCNDEEFVLQNEEQIKKYVNLDQDTRHDPITLLQDDIARFLLGDIPLLDRDITMEHIKAIEDPKRLYYAASLFFARNKSGLEELASVLYERQDALTLYLMSRMCSQCPVVKQMYWNRIAHKKPVTSILELQQHAIATIRKHLPGAHYNEAMECELEIQVPSIRVRYADSETKRELKKMNLGIMFRFL